jgi:death-on-curing protein
MNEIQWLDFNQVLKICHRQIKWDGLRDQGLLESALNRPFNAFSYGRYDDIPALAAVYAFGICQNHPFIDGNKRTAFLSSVDFLELNGYQLVAFKEDIVATFLDLADGKIDELLLVEWFRDNSVLVT